MTEPLMLRDAIEALRSVSGHTHDPNLTRRRIVATVTRRKRQRRHTIAMLLIVFVGLPLGTTAYAAYFGTPAFVQRWFGEQSVAAIDPPRSFTRLTPRRVTVERPLSTRGEGHHLSTTNASRDVAQVPSSASVTRPAHLPLATRGEGKHPTRRIERGEAAPIGVPAVDPSEALYERAHELHFVTRDPSAALDAWNAYIADAHDGSLLPEAHYNRALCLIRLRRNAEAIEALTPFANGTHGNYRSREAAALLQALAK